MVRPPTQCMRMVSMVSAMVITGEMVIIRSAGLGVPAPGPKEKRIVSTAWPASHG